jgi:hypothetical protein
MNETIRSSDGREVEITAEPVDIYLKVWTRDENGNLDSCIGVRLTWDEFDTVADKLHGWRDQVAPEDSIKRQINKQRQLIAEFMKL